MRLGVMMPLTDIGGEPGVVREFAQAAEEIGYTNLGLPDHVLGVNVASRPDWGDRNTSADLFHDPFVCFGFLAGGWRRNRRRIGQVRRQRQDRLCIHRGRCLPRVPRRQEAPSRRNPRTAGRKQSRLNRCNEARKS